MPKATTLPGSAAAQFRHPPEFIATEVTRSWRREHPEWREDETLFTYEFLLEIYRQTRAWWSSHQDASEAELEHITHEIVTAFLRGKRLIPLTDAPAWKPPASVAERRLREERLWNTMSPVEKAGIEYKAWLLTEWAMSRRGNKRREQAVYDSLVRKHARIPRTDPPFSSAAFGSHGRVAPRKRRRTTRPKHRSHA